jgi:hypothetical protein
MATQTVRKKMKITEHDAITGITITRDMNSDELAQVQADKVINEAAQVEAEAKATAKAALLDRLGITAEEASILLS